MLTLTDRQTNRQTDRQTNPGKNITSLAEEGDYNFSLEAVKELGTLISEDDASAVHELQRLEAKVAAVCFHPALPQVFKPLCQRRDAGTALARLGKEQHR
uniref:Guanylate cyclase activator 2B n=1 Tax=Sphaeramia orbicularis TaxID=375764 RepID=A0A672ZW08_9TELE